MFKYQLGLEDGTPADPPTFTAAVPNWKAGDTIPLGGGESYRVVDAKAHRTLNGTLVVTRLVGESAAS